MAIELLEELQNETLPNVLYSGATVQEEVGLRGAQTAANMIKPDLFYALDASPANDASGNKTEFGQLGKGALLRIFDRTMVTHKGMREFVLDTAQSHHIPYQYFTSQGGTDAGRVHLSNEGVPSAVSLEFVRGISIHQQVLFMLMIMQPQKNYLFNWSKHPIQRHYRLFYKMVDRWLSKSNASK